MNTKFILKALGVFSLVLILPFPTAFYFLFRVIVFAGAIYAAVQIKNLSLSRGDTIFFLMIAVAFIYNPIMMVFLYEKAIWIVVNICAALIFFNAASLFEGSKREKSSQGYEIIGGKITASKRIPKNTLKDWPDKDWYLNPKKYRILSDKEFNKIIKEAADKKAEEKRIANEKKAEEKRVQEEASSFEKKDLNDAVIYFFNFAGINLDRTLNMNDIKSYRDHWVWKNNVDLGVWKMSRIEIEAKSFIQNLLSQQDKIDEQNTISLITKKEYLLYDNKLNNDLDLVIEVKEHLRRILKL